MKRCSDEKHEASLTKEGDGNMLVRMQNGSALEVGTKEGGNGQKIHKFSMYLTVNGQVLSPH